MTFQDLDLSNPLRNAIEDLGFQEPTPIQEEAFPMVRSGTDVVGIAQTGTGNTFAYVLPILRDLKFSKQVNPRVLILVPTRELVVQVVEEVEKLAKYMSFRVLGVYGGVNLNRHKQDVAQGCDVLVATPGRLYDLAMSRVLKLKSIQKLVIDEVDVMLDLGFRYQILNIFDLLPQRRQNIMFSATMTEDVDALIDEFFIAPKKIAIAVSGTPLENIEQSCYDVPNFYTKINLLNELLFDKNEFKKVLVFAPNKRNADRIFDLVESQYPNQVCVIHSNKTQNYRLRSIEEFNKGNHRILIATDVIARGLDLEEISHVINFNPTHYPENYMHRIGRTGRAEHKGKSILFTTEKEQEEKKAIEALMNYEIPKLDLPDTVQISNQLTEEERPKDPMQSNNRVTKIEKGEAFHKRKEKNQKTNQGGSYRRKLAVKYKKPKTRGARVKTKKNKKK